MNDAQIFDRYMRDYGGRLERNWAPGSPPDQVYSTLSGWAETLIHSARQHVPSLPPIHFDFVLDGNPNAYAFKTEGRYFIGLTTGLRYLLELVLFRILSDHRLLPFIGTPREEAEALSALTEYKAHAQEMYNAGLRPTRPKTDTRWAYALHLLKQAILFLVGHEIAHITRGHVDYWDSRTGHGLIAELALGETSPTDSLERQTLEFDADRRSVFSAVASARLTHETPGLALPPWAATREAAGMLLFHWAFSMNSLFRLFGDGRFGATELASDSHPPFAMRRLMATLVAYACVMESWNPALKNPTLAALRLAARHTEEAFSIILGENPTLGGLPDAFGSVAREHQERLIEYWTGGLQDRVGPFAYERDRQAPITNR